MLYDVPLALRWVGFFSLKVHFVNPKSFRIIISTFSIFIYTTRDVMNFICPRYVRISCNDGEISYSTLCCICGPSNTFTEKETYNIYISE